MNVRTKMLVVFGVTISLVIFAKIIMSMFDSVIRERYSSYSVAVDNGAHVHGMVPDFLPRSATQIVAERDLDSDTLKVEFSFDGDFDSFLFAKSKKNMALPMDILDGTSLGKVDVDRLQVISSPGYAQECASHLVVDLKARRAVYIYNLSPHKAGCLEKDESL
jgi:hypothetical protein